MKNIFLGDARDYSNPAYLIRFGTNLVSDIYLINFYICALNSAFS
jgi:hypothetical protein